VSESRYRGKCRICATGQWCPIISHFETLALGSSIHDAARRSSSGESGTLQVTAAVFSSAPRNSFVRQVAWFASLYISAGYPLIIFRLFMRSVIYQQFACWRSGIFCTILYTVTKFGKPRQTHAILLFCSTFGYSSPIETWIKIPHWYFNLLGCPLFIHKIVYWIFMDI